MSDEDQFRIRVEEKVERFKARIDEIRIQHGPPDGPYPITAIQIDFILATLATMSVKQDALERALLSGRAAVASASPEIGSQSAEPSPA